MDILIHTIIKEPDGPYGRKSGAETDRYSLPIGISALSLNYGLDTNWQPDLNFDAILEAKIERLPPYPAEAEAFQRWLNETGLSQYLRVNGYYKIRGGRVSHESLALHFAVRSEEHL